MKLRRSYIVRALSVAYLFIFLGLGLYDVPLRPDVVEFLKVPASKVPESENGYFAHLGFTAPPATDIHSFGLQKYSKIMDDVAKKRAQNKPVTSPKDDYPGQISFKGKEFPKEKLYRYVTESSATLDLVTGDNTELISRYRILLNYRQFEEPGVNGHYQDVPIPSFSPIRNTQTLYLLLALRSAQQGKTDNALTAITDDMNYWRAILRQTHTLIGKMISIACIQRDYQVLSELIGHHDLSDSQRERIRASLQPWKSEDANIGESARYEALYWTESFFTSLSEDRVFNRFLIKKNATVNAIAGFQMENARLAKLSPEEFFRSLDSQKARQKELSRLHPDFLYNPLGAILNSIAVPQLTNYFSRFHDLEARRRMVLLHLIAREKGIGHDSMAGFLKESGKEHANPYNGQPMQWDTSRKAIVMNSITSEGAKELRRVELEM